MSTSDIKRLFFGIEVVAPWPEHLPRGRLLDVAHRHMTLAFLGNVPYTPLYSALSSLPHPTFSLAPVGYFDDCLFLPPHRPHAVAWHVHWVNPDVNPGLTNPLLTYQKILVDWLRTREYVLDTRPFLEHVTVARWPFDKVAWTKQSYHLPVIGRAIHLYESMGNLTYEPRWSLPFLAPFESLSHTADIAFKIRGRHLSDLYLHAQMALAFEYPPLIAYLDVAKPPDHDALVEQLNALLSRADTDQGVPFKAVSYHGVPMQRDMDRDTYRNTYLEWEMIVDV